MKSLLLKSMLLVSHAERKALKVTFDPTITMIQGDNDTGKSSVIKTLFWTFGAEPPKLHRSWKNADIASLVSFTLDSKEYSIYRHRRSFSFFPMMGPALDIAKALLTNLDQLLRNYSVSI